MSAPPEVVFDRYFRSNAISAEQRRIYQGKLDLDQLQPGEAGILEDFRKSINSMYDRQRSRVLAHGRHPNLHFDYVRSVDVNALAFRYEDYEFVGLTKALVDCVGSTCEALAGSPVAFHTLGLDAPDLQNRRQVLTLLFALQMQFIGCHELGHHFHGHCSEPDNPSALWEEFKSDVLLTTEDKIDFQAREVDADGFGVEMVLRNLIAGQPRAMALELLSRSAGYVACDDAVLTAFLLSVGAFFFRIQPAFFKQEKIRGREHPPGAIRMHFVMQNTKEWLERNRANSLTWATLDSYQRIMQAVAASLEPIKERTAWDAQTEFLISDAGRAYLDLLRNQVALEREKLNGKRWELDESNEESRDGSRAPA